MGRKSLREKRRKEIVLAFAQLFSEHGFAGATIQSVAEKANLSPGLLHHHFKNKLEMLEELLEYLFLNFKRSKYSNLQEYVENSIGLNKKSDIVLAKCWVGLLAEGIRNPKIFNRIRRLLDSEVSHIERLSQQKMNTKESSSLLAYILGSLIFGAYAPKRSSGFAAENARKLLN